MEEKAIKKTGRGGKYNFPCAVPPEDAETSRAALGSVLHWYDIGKNPVSSVEDVSARLDQFLEYCFANGERPTVEKMCLAIGHPRQTVFDWVAKGDARADTIKRAKDIIASYDAELVSSGKMPQIPYIFRAKNFYGMTDQQQIVVEPRSPLGQAADVAEITGKYKALPED